MGGIQRAGDGLRLQAIVVTHATRPDNDTYRSLAACTVDPALLSTSLIERGLSVYPCHPILTILRCQEILLLQRTGLRLQISFPSIARAFAPWDAPSIRVGDWLFITPFVEHLECRAHVT